MKLHKVEITLTGVAMIDAETEAQAVEIARERLKGKIFVMDIPDPLIFTGSLQSKKRPPVSISPTVTVIRTDDEAVLVHKS